MPSIATGTDIDYAIAFPGIPSTLHPTAGMVTMLRHWADCRSTGDLPQRPPFNPLLLPQQLQNIQLHERRAGGRYFCRVSGTHIVDVLKFESTNRHVDEVIAPAQLQSRTALLDQAIDGGLPVLYIGTLELAGSEWKGVQRLLLPFARDDGRFLLSMVRFLDSAELNSIATRHCLEGHGITCRRTIAEAELLALRAA